LSSLPATRYASVLGLGFGDCGKGLFIDALARRWRAHTVVRFNGGAQAGHNVVEPGATQGAARHHTFSQFGAGTLVPGVRTVLADPVVVHPTALLVEAQVLGGLGVHDALARLAIDAQCRLTTPYHQAAGRLRERLRGLSAHGSCGVGVGETVRQALEQPAQVLRYGDVVQNSAAQTQSVLDKLEAIRTCLATELLPAALGPAALRPTQDAIAAEVRDLQDTTLAARWLASAQALARQCPPQSTDALSSLLAAPGCVLFEGAQGVLLDEWRGFHPHTTWSTISTAAVEQVARRLGILQPIEHYGVLRSYLTRHGAGPLPTHDVALNALYEPHNASDGWQGSFRRGHPDAVLLRYALKAVGDLTGLLLSHMDVFESNLSVKWCENYSFNASHGTGFGNGLLLNKQLAWSTQPDLAHQSKLTQLLQQAQPVYSAEPVRSAAALLERISSVSALPVRFLSYGPTHDTLREMPKSPQ
jgi:adenylosuccinate synthase